MTSHTEQNLVLINKSDKKIVIKRKCLQTSVTPSIKENRDKEPPTASNERTEHVSAQDGIRSLESSKEIYLTVQQKLSTLKRLKSLNFSAPKSDVNIFAGTSPKKSKLDDKKQERKELSTHMLALNHDRRNLPPNSGERIFEPSESKKSDYFQPAKDENIEEIRRELRPSLLRHPLFRNEKSANSKKSAETATPSFTHDEQFDHNDSDQMRRSRDFGSSQPRNRESRDFDQPPSRNCESNDFGPSPVNNRGSRDFVPSRENRDFGPSPVGSRAQRPFLSRTPCGHRDFRRRPPLASYRGSRFGGHDFDSGGDERRDSKRDDNTGDFKGGVVLHGFGDERRHFEDERRDFRDEQRDFSEERRDSGDERRDLKGGVERRDFGERRDRSHNSPPPITLQRSSISPPSFRGESTTRESIDVTSRVKAVLRRDFVKDESAPLTSSRHLVVERKPAEPIIPLVDRLESEKLEKLEIQPDDLKRLSLLGLKSTVEYLCEVNKDLHYQTTRLSNQMAHIKSALACCPKRNLTETELEALLSKSSEKGKDDSTDADVSHLPFESSICEETFASALCKSILDQAEERRRALIASKRSYAAPESLESKTKSCIEAVQCFFSGLASGMVEKIKYDDSCEKHA